MKALLADNPYPGLRPFREDESHLFFGRDGQSEAILTLLQRERFAAVVGVSGCGKSSLVKAGLFPILHAGLFPSAHNEWRIASIRPVNAPIANLAQELAKASVAMKPEAGDIFTPVERIEATLRRSSRGLIELMEQALLEGDEFDLLVVVDQFEELFRYGNEIPSGEKEHFVRLLIEAVRDARRPVHVIITMRSDFLGDCTRFRDLAELINRAEYLVPRMTRAERREAIAGPASLEGVEITPRLLNRLLDDMGDDPDQLPVLQHALRRAWAHRANSEKPGESLDTGDYEAVGTMKGALSQQAGNALECLPDEGKRIAESLFRTITLKGDDNRGVRRPTKLGVIAAIAGVELKELVAVIDVFRDPELSFLVPPVGEPLDEDSVIDISHESLMRNWETLRGWVDTEGKDSDDYWRLVDSAERRQAGDAELLGDLELRRRRPLMRGKGANPVWADLYGSRPQFELAVEYWRESRREGIRRRRDKKRREREERERAAAEFRREEEEKREKVEAEREKQRQLREAAEKEIARRNKLRKFGFAAFAAMAALTAWAFYERHVSKDREQRANSAENTALSANLEVMHTLADLGKERVRIREALARSFSRTIGQTGDRFTEPEVSALWDLATLSSKDDQVRMLYLENVLDSRSSALRFLNRSSQAGASLLGLRVEFRSRLHGLALQKLETSDDGWVCVTGGVIAAQLGENAEATSVALAERMGSESDSEALSSLGRALGSLGERLPPESAAKGAAALAERMGSESDSYAVSSLGSALGSLGERLPPESAAKGAAALARRIGWVATSFMLPRLGSALGSLGERLPPESAENVAAAMAERMASESDSDKLWRLGSALGSLGERLPPEFAAKVAAALAERMASESDSDKLSGLGSALGSLGERLPPESAVKGAAALAERMASESDYYYLSSLGSALGSLGERLPPESAVKGAEVLAKRMASESDSEALSGLGSALGSLGERLPPVSAVKGAEALAKRMASESGYYSLSSLGSALGSLGERLPPESAVKGAAALAERMAKESDSDALWSLGSALASLGEKLPPESAAKVAAALVERMASESDSDALSSLGSTLCSLGERLPPESAAKGAAALAERMASESDSDKLSSLGSALGSLGERLPPESAAKGAAALVARMAKESDPEALSHLGLAMGSLGERLPPEFAAPATSAMLVSDEPDLETLAGLLQRFKNPQDLVEVIKDPFCVGAARVKTLEELEKRLSAPEKKVEFLGDVSNLILRAQELGLDVETPPERPVWLKD